MDLMPRQSKNSIDQNVPIFDPSNLLLYARDKPKRYQSIVTMISNIAARGNSPLTEAAEQFYSGERDHSRRIIHSLKGSTGNIGAMRVFQAADKLETLLSQVSVTQQEFSDAMALLEQRMTEFVAHANEWLSQQPKPRPTSNKDCKDSEVRTKLKQLQQLMLESNIQSFDLYDDLRPALNNSLNDADFAELDRAMQALQFTAALQILTRLS